MLHFNKEQRISPEEIIVDEYLQGFSIPNQMNSDITQHEASQFIEDQHRVYLNIEELEIKIIYT
jgi:hypothetical protein